MEFIGRIERVLPSRSGKSARTGNDWKTTPFVFEYFENENDRYSDKVLLETFDANIQSWIDSNIKIEEDGNIVIIGEMNCKIGFGHHIREYEGKIYNELRIYKMEVLGGINTPPAQEPATEKKDEDPFRQMMGKDAVAAVAQKLNDDEGKLPF